MTGEQKHTQPIDANLATNAYNNTYGVSINPEAVPKAMKTMELAIADIVKFRDTLQNTREWNSDDLTAIKTRLEIALAALRS